MQPVSTQVVVLGGGISGLTAAYRLLQQGCRVRLLEASGDLGGLGGTFEHDGRVMERFYHVMLDSDEHLLGLLRELDLEERVGWRETRMGFLYGRELSPFNTPVDLLRFGALSVAGRLRTALGAAYTAKLVRNAEKLDDRPVSEWLRGIYGPEVYARLWLPLLRAKFGDLHETVPAYWFWARLKREKSKTKEVKGYVEGGYRLITDRLRAAIERMGGEIRTRAAAEAVQETPLGIRVKVAGQWESCGAVISTVAMPILKKIARGRLADLTPRTDLVYQGVVNVVALCRQSVMPYYWAAAVKEDFGFQGAVETTNVVPMVQTGDRRLLYLLNYCQQDSALYSLDDAELKRRAHRAIQDLHPGYPSNAVETMKVFRAPYVEPVWPLGYLKQRPESRVGDSRLYLSTTAQSYPRVNSWNTMVGIANEVAARVAGELTENTSGGIWPERQSA